MIYADDYTRPTLGPTLSTFQMVFLSLSKVLEL